MNIRNLSLSGSSQLPLQELLLRTPSLSQSEWALLNWPARWLVMVRAVVLIMTISACCIGVILAAMEGSFYFDRFLALVIGLTLAHATNNLLNDLIDHKKGIDQNNYFRRRYGTQVLEDGLISEAQFFLIALATGGVALFCAAYLFLVVGAPVLYLTLVGAFFVVFYTWPLKHFALGEISVLLVWGPLLVAGSAYVMTGTVSIEILVVSLVYAVGPTLVIMGKHIDKFEDDSQRQVRSLPVVLGHQLARQVSLGLLGFQLLLLMAMIAAGWYWLALCLLAAPRVWSLVKAFREPAPQAKPANYPEDIWPLWYAAFGFAFSRDFGLLLTLALILQWVIGS